MTADLFKKFAEKYNMKILSQELINWCGNSLIDSFSIFTKDKLSKNEIKFLSNKDFMKEAELIKKVSNIYHSK